MSFIGISNYVLDTINIKRALIKSIPNLEESLDELIETVKKIVESISTGLFNENNSIFEILSSTYFEYKSTLIFLKELIIIKKLNHIQGDYEESGEEPRPKKKKKVKRQLFGEIKSSKDFIHLFKTDKKINENFHGNQDLYGLIKGIAFELQYLGHKDNKTIIDIIEKKY